MDRRKRAQLAGVSTILRKPANEAELREALRAALAHESSPD